MQIIRSITVFLIIGTILAQAPLEARLVDFWSYDELVNASDVVVVIETLKNEKNNEKFDKEGRSSADFQGISTTFHVLYIWKGNSSPGDLIVKHFVYKPNVGYADGALFIHFPIKPLIFEGKVQVSGDSKDFTAIKFGLPVPNWLAFLKKAPDGSYVPVTGQYDASLSFRALTEAGPDLLRTSES